ncbi:MAG: CoA pyrophosphatase [Saprospiraceae bacterium]|nr:CoA pyrophosphatase [Saprospiraceae bacterium]
MKPLPGPEAQFRMAHGARVNYPEPNPHTRDASVLLLLFPEQDEWSTLFIQRVSHNPKDKHSGQIAFPGGMKDPGDDSLRHTALREAQEEVGLASEKVNLLGELSPLFISVSNFMVHPFVGMVDHKPSWTLQEKEVAGIIETPINFFTNPKQIEHTNIRISDNLRLRNVPYFNMQGKVLWGATAMILNEFLELEW